MLGKELVDSILEDHQTATIDDRLRATLTFLQKMTLEPHVLDAEDAKRAKEAGVTKEALIEAAQIAFNFNLIDRLADAFDFAVPPSEGFSKMVPMMLKKGYRI